MQSAPTTWPEGTHLGGACMLKGEREAWLLGFKAGSDDAARQIREAIQPSHSEVEIPEEQ